MMYFTELLFMEVGYLMVLGAKFLSTKCVQYSQLGLILLSLWSSTACKTDFLGSYQHPKKQSPFIAHTCLSFVDNDFSLL